LPGQQALGNEAEHQVDSLTKSVVAAAGWTGRAYSALLRNEPAIDRQDRPHHETSLQRTQPHHRHRDPFRLPGSPERMALDNRIRDSRRQIGLSSKKGTRFATAETVATEFRAARSAPAIA